MAGQQDDSIRNEIESFLQDVLGQKPPQRKQPPRRQADEQDFLEIVEEEPPRRKRKKKKQLQRKRKSQQKKQTSIENRKVGQSGKSFGSDLREHVSEHMQLQHYEDDMGHNIDQSVLEHLGTFSGSGDEVQLVSASAQLRKEVLKMLRHPEDVRKAMMLNLILSPPTSLKKK